jgi:glutamate-1-semialdehyde 2,1-aminomutase/spore coat polysaccharide biosynthesis protein SpsF
VTQQRNIVAIVQARMGSTRLPGKVLANIAGKTMLEHIVLRLSRSRLISDMIIATSSKKVDDCIVQTGLKKYFKVFRGDENDVLDRYYHAAKSLNADIVVRITGDCPLIDPEVVDRVIEGFLAEECDYASNTLVCTYPDGLDTEVFSFEALETAWRDARRVADREHVTPFIRTSRRFRLHNVESDLGRVTRHLRWTVDEPRDLEFIRAVYERLGANGVFNWYEVLELLDSEPTVGNLNSGLIRNEGFYRSIAREEMMPPRVRSLDASQELARRAAIVIPGSSQTLSKGATQYVQGVAPVFLARGQGSHVWDVDGNEYIDFPMALGPIILGHAYAMVDEAVRQQMTRGVSFSLPHPLEVEVAERLVDMVPCAEMVRFGKNGSDATAGAVRLARAYTGRDLVVCCGYHGWQDWYIGSTPFNRGVPKAVGQLTESFEYNSIQSLKDLLDRDHGRVAAVILEPVGVVEPQADFLQQVRQLCKREGCLLIFDEVVTGFRLARGGAQEYFGVVPDLACFGKAMANGYPLSAVVGQRDIMKHFEQTFFSFTFGGETLSLAAGLATMKEIAEKEVIAQNWEQGEKIKDGLGVLVREFGMEGFVRCDGLPPRTVVTFFDESGRESLLLKSLFQQECLKRGVLFSGGQNICFSHTDEDVDYTLRAYRAALEIIADALRRNKIEERLEGRPVQAVFRRA